MEELNMRQKDLVGIIGGKKPRIGDLEQKEKIDRRYDKGTGADSSDFGLGLGQ